MVVTMKQQIRILLADDHSIMRVGLASLLSREKDMTVVGEAETGEEAVAKARELKPDVVIMDLMMPTLSGAEATRQITDMGGTHSRASTTEITPPRVLVFTSYGTSADLANAVLNGASGVLLKNAPTRDLPQAIRKVFAGEKVLSKEIQALVNEGSSTPHLTDRQLKQLELAARGFTNQEIADQLNVSLITIKKQFSEIFARLNVSNRSEAIGLALQRNIIKM
jgi:two-component system NarL family response regulator